MAWTGSKAHGPLAPEDSSYVRRTAQLLRLETDRAQARNAFIQAGVEYGFRRLDLQRAVGRLDEQFAVAAR